MEFYNARMYASNCKTMYTMGFMYLYQGTSYIVATMAYDWNNFNNFHFDSLAAGTYTLKFKPKWDALDVKDYTIRLYSADKIAITAA